jgi:hypothetical protein
MYYVTYVPYVLYVLYILYIIRIIYYVTYVLYVLYILCNICIICIHLPRAHLRQAPHLLGKQFLLLPQAAHLRGALGEGLCLTALDQVVEFVVDGLVSASAASSTINHTIPSRTTTNGSIPVR